jgi:hypothetical protein
MNTYKITNVTNLVGKRDPKFNMPIDVEYIDNRTKKSINLKAGESVFLTVNSLPLSVHRLRIKKLIEISEVSAAELVKSMEKTKPQPITKPKSVRKVVTEEKKKETQVETQKKSTTYKKKSTDE